VTTTQDPRDAVQRHGRESSGFARVANLSDAVFAIAMTLLVLTIEVPDVPADGLASALVDDLPQLGAYVLAFALIASQWYVHHKLFSRLAWIERGLLLTNLVYLGLVALVPFPTGVFGMHPTSTAAVAPFLALFVLLNLTASALIMRAQVVGAWAEPVPPAVFSRIVASLLTATAFLILGIVVAVWMPLLAVAMAAFSGTPTAVIMRRAPARYRGWL
jgi:uncharacterized membrane protein